MDFLVLPSGLASGNVDVPGDKSISHRALMLGAVAEGRTEVKGLLLGDDCVATLAALKAMGVRIEQPNVATAIIEGVGLHGLTRPDGDLDLGNSGTGMRLLTGLLCGQDFDSRLTGDASLSRRPMARVIKPLTLMGAAIDSADGRPPLAIQGGKRLVGITYELPVASAQVKSAILLAGLYARGETFVTEPAITRDHTERLLSAMGVSLSAESGRVRMPGQQALKATGIDVPGDLSSAAFLILAALLGDGCELLIRRVGVNPTRTGVIEILREMGAQISLENPALLGEEPAADLRVRSSVLQAIELDADRVSSAIDEFPVLFVAAAAARGVSRFSGLAELRVKESDRIAAMVQGLRALGIAATETQDGAEISGGDFTGGTIDSHGDHRVAMAFAVAATRAAGPVQIHDVQTVDTSFPGFMPCLQALGIGISRRDGAA